MDTHRRITRIAAPIVDPRVAPIADEQAPAEARAASDATADLRDERAATAIEYGLIAALIAVAILAALTLTGSSLTALYQYWSSAVVAAL